MLSGDSLSYHREMPFSTWDRDNSKRKCANRQSGGWWFNRCFYSNLNGIQEEDLLSSGMIWMTWRGYEPVKASEMKIKRITPDTGILITSYICFLLRPYILHNNVPFMTYLPTNYWLLIITCIIVASIYFYENVI